MRSSMSPPRGRGGGRSGDGDEAGSAGVVVDGLTGRVRAVDVHLVGRAGGRSDVDRDGGGQIVGALMAVASAGPTGRRGVAHDGSSWCGCVPWIWYSS